MDTVDENRHITLSERWLIKAAEWNPELSSKYRNQQINLEDHGKDGKMTSTNSSNKLRKIQKT